MSDELSGIELAMPAFTPVRLYRAWYKRYTRLNAPLAIDGHAYRRRMRTRRNR